MIDIHSHILPGVDDGAKTFEESLSMGKRAVEEGITTIVATPHHQNGVYTNEGEMIQEVVEELQSYFDEAGVPLTVLSGQEPRIHGDIIENLDDGSVLKVNGSDYVLIELPHDSVPEYTGRLLYEMQLAGYKPIVVHPERNTRIQEEPDILYEFVRKGAYSQLTAASVTGKFGKKVEKLSESLVKANLVHFIASDAHNTHSRGFCIKEAYQVIQEKYGQDWVSYFDRNAKAVVANEVIMAEIPEKVGRKKFFGLF